MGGADELVGQGIGGGQQEARDGGGQVVELRLEFRFGQFPAHCIEDIDLPGVLAQEARQRAAGEEAQVGAIQQSLFTIAELTLQQLCNKAGIPRIRHGHQQLALRSQQGATGLENALRLAQMLQNVGADDVVVASICK